MYIPSGLISSQALLPNVSGLERVTGRCPPLPFAAVHHFQSQAAESGRGDSPDIPESPGPLGK